MSPERIDGPGKSGSLSKTVVKHKKFPLTVVKLCLRVDGPNHLRFLGLF